MVIGPVGMQSMPVMHFKPDPGEPAVRLAATEAQSAGLVSTQEQRNETRLRMRAMAQGEDVLFTNRTFTLGVGDVSPTINGGLTTVVTRTDSNGFLPNSVYQPQAPSNDEMQAADESEETQVGFDPLADSSTDLQNAAQPSEDELEEQEQDLESEDQRLERNITMARMEMDRAIQSGNPTQIEETRREEAKLEREMDDNEKEKRSVELERLQQKMDDFQQDADQVLEQNLAAATGILDLFSGANTQAAPRGIPMVTAGNTTPNFSFAR
jgi:hypothetical protein